MEAVLSAVALPPFFIFAPLYPALERFNLMAGELWRLPSTIRMTLATLLCAASAYVPARRRQGSPLMEGAHMSTHISRRTFAAFLFTFGLLFGAGADAQQLAIDAQGRTVLRRPMPQGGGVDTLAFVRTELFFGTAKPDGVVSDAEFRAFIDEVVTPRFPDGLTLLEADGQFRGSDNVIIKEKSFVLILLYPVETQRVSSRRIERIRTIYKEQFQQQSVLRVDDPRAVRVSF